MRGLFGDEFKENEITTESNSRWIKTDLARYQHLDLPVPYERPQVYWIDGGNPAYGIEPLVFTTNYIKDRVEPWGAILLPMHVTRFKLISNMVLMTTISGG